MVTFVCEICQDSIKKAKLDAHKIRCPRAVFTCIDCSTTFEGTSYKAHTSCKSEDEKYQKSVYNPRNERPSKKRNVKGEAIDALMNGHMLPGIKDGDSAGKNDAMAPVEATVEIKENIEPLENQSNKKIKLHKEQKLEKHSREKTAKPTVNGAERKSEKVRKEELKPINDPDASLNGKHCLVKNGDSKPCAPSAPVAKLEKQLDGDTTVDSLLVSIIPEESSISMSKLLKQLRSGVTELKSMPRQKAVKALLRKLTVRRTADRVVMCYASQCR